MPCLKSYSMHSGATDPFREMEMWKNSTEIQQLGHAPRSGPEVKKARRRGSDAGQSRSRRLKVVVQSPPLYSRDGPKWRDNYPEGPDHPVTEVDALTGYCF